MNVAVVGNDTLDWDIDALYKFIRRSCYPHPVSIISTTREYGTAESARMVAEKYDIQLCLFDDRYSAIDFSDMTILLRKNNDYPSEIKYSARKNKLFRELVV